MQEFTPAGRLIHVVTVERITGKLQSDTGETFDVWTATDIDVPAEVKPLRGRNVEIAAARTKGRVLSHQITMRFVDELEPATCRIVHEGQLFEIFQSVDVMERHAELDVLCNVREA
jgi:head-tail adaptor